MSVFKTVIELPEAFVREREDNIIQVTFKEGATLDLDLQIRIHEKYHEICKGKRLPFLYEAMDHVTVTREAKEYTIKIEDTSPVKASAIVVNNLAYKLIAEFYQRINKPKKPFKIFRKEADAVNWLKQFLKDEPHENKKPEANSKV